MKYLLLVLIFLTLGYWYYHTHPSATKQTQDAAKNAQIAGAQAVDAVTTASFGGASHDAQVYYLKNRNYGTSDSKNICVDVTSNEGFGDIISAIKKVKNVVACSVDTNYPSKSFTVVVPSLVTRGSYYCTDQNGFVGLIPNLTNGNYANGLHCK